MMEFKKMAEDAGLKITSSHVNPPTGEYTPDTRNTIMEYWKKTADDHAKLGVKYLVQPDNHAPVVWKRLLMFAMYSMKLERLSKQLVFRSVIIIMILSLPK